ncbi:MAG: hypothetical protein JWP12_2523 [Bacteroidetes bacterium]|nr:hypothetical protein [Bacteroidota bacterium]
MSVGNFVPTDTIFNFAIIYLLNFEGPPERMNSFIRAGKINNPARAGRSCNVICSSAGAKTNRG